MKLSSVKEGGSRQWSCSDLVIGVRYAFVEYYKYNIFSFS